MSVKDMNHWFSEAINKELREPSVNGELGEIIRVNNGTLSYSLSLSLTLSLSLSLSHTHTLSLSPSLSGTRTVLLDQWMEVVECKLTLDQARRKFKQRTLHRVAALRRYGLKQRAEADLIRRFKKKVGSPSNTIMYVYICVCMYIYIHLVSFHLTCCFN